MIKEKKTLSVSDVYSLNQAIEMLMNSATSISGRCSFALDKTAQACTKVLTEYEPKRLKIFKKNCEYDKDGQLVMVEEEGKHPMPKMKNGKKTENHEKEMAELLSEKVDIELTMLFLNDLSFIQYDQSRNPLISMIFDVMVKEQESKLVQA